MSRSDDNRLEDIADAAAEIAAVVAGGRARFERDRLVQLATERLLEIIGEAMAKMSMEFREEHPQVEWPQVIGMRNLLAHAYHRVDIELVWKAASESVPSLLVAIRLP